MRFWLFISVLTLTLSHSSLAAVSAAQFHSLAQEFITFINPRVQQVQPDQQVAMQLIESERFLASATKPITFSTGFINHSKVNADVVVLTMCHEVGHNVAVARHFTPENSVYDDSHLEQDYFAVYDCFTPFILGSSTSRERLSTQQLKLIPEGVQNRCAAEHEHPQVCLRAIHASYSLLLAIYDANYVRFSLNGAASFEREWRGHSDELQSRLLNFINGIFKDKPFYMGPSESEGFQEFKL